MGKSIGVTETHNNAKNVSISANIVAKGTWFLARYFDLIGFKTCKTSFLLNSSQTKSLTTNSRSVLKL